MAHETETGDWPEDIPVLTEVGRSIKARAHGAQSLSVDQSDRSDRSINKTMPWIALLAILSTGALVVSIMGLILQRQEIESEKSLRNQQYTVLWDKYQVTERECRLAQDDVTKYMQRGIK